jgi:hypothetical protein
MLETPSVVMSNLGLQFKKPEEFSKIRHPWAAHESDAWYENSNTSPRIWTKLGAQTLGDKEIEMDILISEQALGLTQDMKMFQRSLLLLQPPQNVVCTAAWKRTGPGKQDIAYIRPPLDLSLIKKSPLHIMLG